MDETRAGGHGAGAGALVGIGAADLEATLQPLERATMLPPAAFLEPAVLDWELANIFRAGWVCAGHVSAVAEPGAFVRREVGGESIVVVGGEDGEVRAFHNVCRHRGAGSSKRPRARSAAACAAPTTPGPTTSRASCRPPRTWRASRTSTTPATAWSRSAPRSLGGLVFIDIGGEAGPVEEHVGELVTHLDHYSNAALARGGIETYEVAANWKGIAENYNECLHCPGVHPELNALSDYMSGEGFYGAGAWCGGSMTLNEGAETMGKEGGHGIRPPIASLEESDLRNILYFALFPNALVSLHPDYAMLHTLWPREPGRTDIVCEFFFEPTTIAEPGFDPGDAIRFWDQTNRQDWHVCEIAQQGVADSGYSCRPLLGRGKRRPRLRRDGRRPLPRRPARGGRMNPVAEKLGELGLPQPLSELAAREWDAVVVGGGHNGLTAAAYLARAGKSVLVLERRERLGGACTLERPFEDQDFVVSPCAYVVGLLDELVMRELDLRRRGLRFFVADPNLWVPFEDGTSFGQWLDDDHTLADLKAMGLSQKDIDGYWAYEELFDETRKRLRTGARDSWVGDSPTRHEIEELLHGEQEMIDLVFEASIGDVLDEYLDDQRLKDALFGQGVIGTWGGPYEPGTASIKLMHYQGDLEGQGPVWGYVEGGMGMISFAIADAAIEAGATLACGVPVSRILPGEGVVTEDGTTIRAASVLCNADPKVALELLGEAELDADYRERLEAWKVRSPVVKYNASLSRLPNWTAAPGEEWPARATIDLTAGVAGLPGGVRKVRRRRAGGRLRRDLHPDRLRQDAGAGGQAPDERLRPVRPLRHRRGRLGEPPRRRREAVRRPDQPLRARLRRLPRGQRGARPTRHREPDRPHRRQHLPGRGDPRPDVGGPPPRPHPGPRPLPLRRRHPPGGQRHRAERAQCRRSAAGGWWRGDWVARDAGWSGGVGCPSSLA